MTTTTAPHPVVLYCKSYRRDVLRVRRLLDSIERHNVERLPVFVSVPREDRALFEQMLGARASCTLIDDEDIATANPRVTLERTIGVPGRLSQAMIRAEFWRLGHGHNYLCIDSDSVFIADFRARDFVAPDGDCYTVIHQNKELLQLAANRGIDKMDAEFRHEAAQLMKAFGRDGPIYSFMPSPFVWSAKVWRSLDERHLQPRGQTVWDAFNERIPEYLWYGEALLAFQAIPLRPIEALFRVYHYHWQYYSMRKLGETEAKAARNYLGIIYQSNWEHEMDYGAPHKSLPSRALRAVKRGLRYVQNRWL
jgi:hypothetical protein